MKKSFARNITYKKLARLWLMSMLFFMPVQFYIVKKINLWNEHMATFINRLDEMTIVVFILLAIIEFFKNKTKYRLYIMLLFPIFMFSISVFVSGIINDNSMFVTMIGIFDYMKPFLILFVYAAFFTEYDDIKNIWRLLLIMAVVFGIIAFIQEVWALGFRYIGGKSVTDSGLYILRPLVDTTMAEYFWRFGAYRAPSLIVQANYLGFHSLFILTIYFTTTRKINYFVMVPIFLGIVTSISRIIYMGLLFITGIRFFIFKKRSFLLFIPVVLIIVIMSVFSNFNVLDKPIQLNMEIDNIGSVGEISYRGYTLSKCLEVWRDHPVMGVGPGMFGSPISSTFYSHLYDEYNFSNTWIFKSAKSIDLFIPYLLAESGIAGTIFYANIFITLFAVLAIFEKQATPDEAKIFFKGLKISLMLILIWICVNDIYTPTIFTYFALVGVGLGCVSREDNIN